MTAAPTRPIMRWHGGKWRLAKWIIAQFPAHHCYCEAFGGAASVLVQKQPSKFEVYNDRYGRVVNVFRVLRDPEASGRLKDLLRWTAYAEDEYRLAREISDDPVEDARRMLTLGHQAHGSTGACGGKRSGWRRGIRPHGPSSADEWKRICEHVESWALRLRGVYIENAGALEVMRRWDGADTLHYVDPPYLAETRTFGARAYAHEMDNDDHRALASGLQDLRGSVIVSGYPSQLYEELFADWQRIERQHLADKANQRTEVLWLRNVDHGLFGTKT